MDREFLGKLVRATWIAWAKEQSDVDKHPGWLTEWGGLLEREKEVDRRIGEAVANVAVVSLTDLRAQLASATATIAEQTHRADAAEKLLREIIEIEPRLMRSPKDKAYTKWEVVIGRGGENWIQRARAALGTPASGASEVLMANAESEERRRRELHEDSVGELDGGPEGANY